MHERLMVVGANGHGKVVADIAQRMGHYKDIGFLDDNPSIKEAMGIPVLGNCSEFSKFIATSDIFVAIGNSAIRKRLLEQLVEMDAEIPILIHPQAIIGRNVILDIGSVVMAGAVINPDARIGKGCIVNTCASVDHDCILEDYVHVSVGAHLAGAVKVGENTWIGIGAMVKNNINICCDSMIGAGAVVVKDIAEAGTYIGIPAKKAQPAKYRNESE